MKVPLRRLAGVIDQTVSATSNSAVVIVASHRLAAEQVGTIAVGISIALILIAVSRAFTSSPLVLEYAAESEVERRRAAAEAARSGWLASSVVSVALLGVGLAVGGPIGGVVAVVGAGAVVLVVQDLLRYVAFVLDRSWLALVSDGVWLAVFVLVVLVVPASTDSPTWLMAAWVAGAAVGLVVAVVLLRLPLHRGARGGWLRRHRALSVNLIGDIGLVAAYGFAIPLILAAVSTLDQAGRYRLAQTAVGPVLVLIASFGLDLQPSLVRLAKEGRPVLWPAVRRSLLVVVAAFSSAAFFVLVPERWLEPVLGAQWGRSVWTAAVLALSAAATAIVSSALLALRALGPRRRSCACVPPSSRPPAAIVLGAAVGGALGASVALAIANLVTIVPWMVVARRAEVRFVRSGCRPRGGDRAAVRT